MNPLLTISHLSKTFDGGTKALKDVSLEVKPGEFLIIIGLSGSGKTTLLRCLNHLVKPTSGKILFKNQNITHLTDSETRHVRSKIAMIFQHFNLVDRHTVLSNVLNGALYRQNTFKSIFGIYSEEEKQQALKYISLMGIKERAHHRADQLSGGQKQRVAIARALMQQPELLLADEPVASLDPATCHTVMEYLEKVNKELGITVICNLHFLSLVRRYGTRVIAMKNGEIIFSGSPQEIDEKWFKTIYGESAQDVQIE